MDDYSTVLGFALEAARAGGRIALGHFGNEPRSEQKADGTWVTEADWAVESQIRLRIARAFPDHNVLGEEEGLTAAGGGRPNDGAPTWVVDPIDGTNNYMSGIPIWGVLVGLRIDGRSVLGVAEAPALAETYDSGLGLGARHNGSPIQVNEVSTVADATISFADAQAFYDSNLGDFFDDVCRRAWRTRGFGDFWGHMLVARGSIAAMIEPELSLWDVAALEPIVT